MLHAASPSKPGESTAVKSCSCPVETTIKDAIIYPVRCRCLAPFRRLLVITLATFIGYCSSKSWARSPLPAMPVLCARSSAMEANPVQLVSSLALIALTLSTASEVRKAPGRLQEQRSTGHSSSCRKQTSHMLDTVQLDPPIRQQPHTTVVQAQLASLLTASAIILLGDQALAQSAVRATQSPSEDQQN